MILFDGSVTILGLNIRKVFLDEPKLGISSAPELETGNTFFPARANDQITAWNFGMIEVFSKALWA